MLPSLAVLMMLATKKLKSSFLPLVAEKIRGFMLGFCRQKHISLSNYRAILSVLLECWLEA